MDLVNGVHNEIVRRDLLRAPADPQHISMIEPVQEPLSEPMPEPISEPIPELDFDPLLEAIDPPNPYSAFLAYLRNAAPEGALDHISFDFGDPQGSPVNISTGFDGTNPSASWNAPSVGVLRGEDLSSSSLIQCAPQEALLMGSPQYMIAELGNSSKGAKYDGHLSVTGDVISEEEWTWEE